MEMKTHILKYLGYHKNVRREKCIAGNTYIRKKPSDYFLIQKKKAHKSMQKEIMKMRMKINETKRQLFDKISNISKPLAKLIRKKKRKKK